MSLFNRNNYRKVYGYTRQPPQPFTFVENGEQKSVDANKFNVTREFYRISEKIGTTVGHLDENAFYEEDTIAFFSSTTKTLAFLREFPGTPIVVVSVEPGGDNNVNAYVASVSPSAFSIGVSDVFTGTVRYRAVYSPSYPVYVQNYPHAPTTIIRVSAGTIDLTDQSYFSGSFPVMAGLPRAAYYSSYDINSNSDANVAVTVTPVTLNTFAGSVSAPITNRVNFLEVE